MKKTVLLSVLVFAVLTSLCAQQQEARYVIVPIKIYKFDKVDIYGLSSLTNQLFAKAGYRVLTGNKMSWPADLQANPCKALYAETEDVSPLIGLTKVKISLKNCYHKVLAESIGKDNDLDDIKALHIALEEAFDVLKKNGQIENAFSQLPITSTQTTNTSPKPIAQKVPTTPIQTEEVVQKKEAVSVATNFSKMTTLKNYWEQFGTKSIEGIYTKNNETFYIKYDEGVFVLYNANDTSIAKIFSTTVPTIFKVTWKEGDTEVGYLKEATSLILEHHGKEANAIFEFKKEFPNE